MFAACARELPTTSNVRPVACSSTTHHNSTVFESEDMQACSIRFSHVDIRLTPLHSPYPVLDVSWRTTDAHAPFSSGMCFLGLQRSSWTIRGGIARLLCPEGVEGHRCHSVVRCMRYTTSVVSQDSLHCNEQSCHILHYRRVN